MELRRRHNEEGSVSFKELQGLFKVNVEIVVVYLEYVFKVYVQKNRQSVDRMEWFGRPNVC